jgi:hypothetical protein
MTDETTSHAESLFTDALDWLGRTYGDRVFFVERDIVYTVQSKLNELISSQAGKWRVYNDYPMLPGRRRSLSADLALLTPQGEVAVAAEFKYEPCHHRLDVLQNKLPVTVWAEIVKDTVRVQEFVNVGRTRVAYAVCIDEGRYLARRDLAIYADRQVWDGRPHHDHPVDALIFRYPAR